jgi:hypothetical protein
VFAECWTIRPWIGIDFTLRDAWIRSTLDSPRPLMMMYVDCARYQTYSQAKAYFLHVQTLTDRFDSQEQLGTSISERETLTLIGQLTMKCVLAPDV